MTFVHDNPVEFDDLLRIVAEHRQLAVGLVEKDYWVTHVLWSLHQLGLTVWFKGGTSLSKGFGLIERFSEDLDLKLEPGRVAALTVVSNWKSEGTKATAERRAYFNTLVTLLDVNGMQASLDSDDKAWRNANVRLTYPARHLGALSEVMRPFVLLEVGNARVTPAVTRAMSSFVHDFLAERNQLAPFTDNRPAGVSCVHPLVTLLEKLDALHRRFPNEKTEPGAFVRHFEDAARVIAAVADLPLLSEFPDVKALANEMLSQKQLARPPTSEDPAFEAGVGPRWESIRSAHNAIAPMFWGPRIELDDTCSAIRAWIRQTFGR